MVQSPNTARTSPSVSRSLLRVLCLHDAKSNSLELSTKLDSLGEKLYRNHGIDLVFVDAPLIVTANESGENTGEGDDDSVPEVPRRINNGEYRPPRAWWEVERGSSARVLFEDEGGEDKKEDDENGDGNDLTKSESDSNTGADTSRNELSRAADTAAPPSDQRPPRYVGLDASLLLLRQLWNSSPFWGILAVGQAAGVAALLSLLPSQGKEGQPPSFMIFVNGRTLLDEEELLTEHLSMPCLHVIDSNAMEEDSDEYKAAASSRFNPTERLVRQFGGKIVCDDNGSWSGRSSPSSRSIRRSSRPFNNHVGRFLVDQKRRLRKTVGDAVVLALRHELHQTEADAAQLVAKQIAKNPPDALMAVITPRDVGGFRDKRRGPGEEGGGAPCPSEFLLHRAKRSGNPGTGNRNCPGPSPESGPPRASHSPGGVASRHHPNQQTASGGRPKER
mmetsp:Transcript_16529/g.38199  ORF Transcript_16529/g.38199 Transcript_16529/m.38199 type:complete len:447 (-) Transcript_16529:317-1657(-)